MRNVACAFLVFIVLALFPSPLHASWDASGNPVVIAPGDQREFSATPFLSGGVLVAWADDLYGPFEPDVRAQALTAEGDLAPGWPAGGVVVCAATGVQRSPSVVADGTAGVFVSWWDYRTGFIELFLQRLTAEGLVAPGWPADGMLIASGVDDDNDSGPVLESDAAGGVYVGWSVGDVIHVGRIDSGGLPTPGWPAAGIVLGPGRAARSFFDVIRDGSDGLYLARTDPPLLGTFGTNAVLMHRWTAAGAAHPDWPASGIDVTDGSFGVHVRPALIDAGTAGVLVYWDENQSGAQGIAWPEGHATRVSAAGVIDSAWPPDGFVTGHGGSVVADTQGGLLVAWSPAPVAPISFSYFRAFATRVGGDATRSEHWSEAGNHVCSEPRSQGPPVIAPDGAGGAFLSWIDYRAGVGLYGSRLTPTGAISDDWPATGSMAAPDAVEPRAPALVVTGPGAATVVWSDRRNGSWDLYAEPAVPGPPGPEAPLAVHGAGTVSLGIAIIGPNPTRGRLWVSLALPYRARATLDVFDVAGRPVAVRHLDIRDPARVTIAIDETERLSSGVYWLRLQQQGRATMERFAVVR